MIERERQEREERVDVMRRLREGSVRLAVTTEMGARGLDLPKLTHVVKYAAAPAPARPPPRRDSCGSLSLSVLVRARVRCSLSRPVVRACAAAASSCRQTLRTTCTAPAAS